MNTSIRETLITEGLIKPAGSEPVARSGGTMLDEAAHLAVARELRDVHPIEALPEILARCHESVRRIVPQLAKRRRPLRIRDDDFEFDRFAA
jgi:hypothetical protein